ncbi:replication-relaxation family protein [Flindersiella endophytica]
MREERVIELAERLSERDWHILDTLNRLKLATGAQLERAHFHELDGRSRAVVRSRILGRLVEARAIVPLPERVGTGARGSGRLVYALDSAGVRLLRLRGNLRDESGRIRRPGVPGAKFIRHTLATSEVFVGLGERVRTEPLVSLDEFDSEPASWWPSGIDRVWLKPDAYIALSTVDATDHYWCEVDLATEALSTLHAKFSTYLDFVYRGQTGPRGVIPRVVVTVPTEPRLAAVERVLRRLPDPAAHLFAVVRHEQAADFLLRELRAPDE